MPVTASKAAILTIGNELLIGQVIDTNAVWLAQELNQVGVAVATSITVGDDIGSIRWALEQCKNQSDVIILTGGLGPTPDDLTRDAVADFLGVPMELDEDALENVRARFASWDRAVPSGSEGVAMVPRGFECLPNPVGTACGLWHKDIQGKVMVLLPGVPHELKTIYGTYVVPRLLAMPNRIPIIHRTLRTVGIGETMVQRRLGITAKDLPANVQIAYLPGPNQVRLRITATGRERCGFGKCVRTGSQKAFGLLYIWCGR